MLHLKYFPYICTIELFKIDIMNDNLTSASLYVAYNRKFDMVKIGISANPESRKAAFQSSCGCVMEILYVSKPFLEVSDMEQKVLKKFERYKALGEWFDGHLDEILQYAKEISSDGTLDTRAYMYLDGVPIAEIARKHNVSRQAILQWLKRTGLYVERHKENKPIMTTTEKPKAVKKRDLPKGCPITKIPSLDKAKRDTRKIRLAQNLYGNSAGYWVKYWKDGEIIEENFRTRNELLDAFDLPKDFPS